MLMLHTMIAMSTKDAVRSETSVARPVAISMHSFVVQINAKSKPTLMMPMMAFSVVCRRRFLDVCQNQRRMLPVDFSLLAFVLTLKFQFSTLNSQFLMSVPQASFSRRVRKKLLLCRFSTCMV